MESTGSDFSNPARQALTQGRTGRLCPTCSLHVSDDMRICPNDGTSLSLAFVPKIVSNLAGQYEFLGKIGEGGMGVIYKARHIALNQMVAIKMMHVNRLDEGKVLRFQQEAKAVSALDHPSIVRVRDFGISESGQPHMVLDFIDGVTLEQFIKTHGPLSLRDAKDMAVQICDAIGHAHSRNVLHRDLKPSNIMLVYRENDCPLVKIVDFGIAKVTDPDREQGMSLTRTGEVFGSPFYMSPEQTAGKELDKRSDIYSVGCVLFEALTGTPPFVGQNAIETLIKHTSEAPPTLQEASLGRDFPVELQAVVSKVLAKDPAARYQDMSSLKTALISAFDNVSAAQASKASSEKSRKMLSRPKLIAAVAAGCALCIALVAIVLMNSKAPPVVSGAKTSASAPSASTAATNGSTPGERRGAGATRDSSVTSAALTAPGTRSSTLKSSTGSINLDSLSDDPLMHVEDLARDKILAQKDKDTIEVAGWFSDKALSAFSEVKSASKIYLEETSIEGPGLEHLIKLPITVLSLNGGVKFTNVGLDSISLMPQLQYLDLTKTKVDDSGMAELRSLTKLQTLNLGYTPLTGIGLSSLEGMAIRNLALNSCTRIQDSDLRSLQKMHYLEALSLEDTDITNAGLRVMSSGVGLPHLRTLKLGATNITDEGMKYLKSFPRLQELSISGTEVTGDGLRTLLNNNRTLVKLDISKCKKLREEDWSLLKKAPGLRELILEDWRFSPNSLKALTDLNLTTLSIGKSHLTDEGLLILAGAKTLKTIDILHGADVTQRGASQFFAIRPDCEILHNGDDHPHHRHGISHQGTQGFSSEGREKHVQMHVFSF